MDTLEAIFSRRSIRKYTDQPIPEALIENMLRAAMAAPSAGNQQPWHFVVIDDRSILNAIPQYHPYAEMLKKSPAAITVCGDLRKLVYNEFWVQDCSAATQNILLAAHSQGLGAVWVGLYPDEERVPKTQQLLGLPAEVIPFSFVALGYPAEQKQPSKRYHLSRIHRNTW
jgi:nitroreductase